MGEDKKANKHIGWRTTGKERWSYYMGFSGIVSQSAIVANYLSTYILLSGIDIRVSAIIILIIKFIDAIDDILFGFIVDKIKFSGKGFIGKLLGNGSYLPWIRLVFLLLPLAAITLYNMPPGMNDVWKIVWFSVGYLLWDLFYTIIDVPMNAMVTTMTDNTDERNVLIANRMYPEIILVLAITSLSTVLISEKVGVPIGTAVIVLSAFVLLTILPIALGVKEHCPRQAAQDEDEKYTLRDMLRYLKGNKYLSLLYGGSVIRGCFATGAGVGLFVAFYLFDNSLFSLVYTAAGIVPVLILMVFVPKLARRFDKFKMAFITNLISIGTSTLIYFLGYKNVGLHLAALVIHIIPSTFSGILLNFLCPSCVEYGKYKTGVDGTGISFAIQTFTFKMTGAIASSFGLLVLGLFGWVSIEAASFAELAESGITQSAEALRGLWFVNAGVPVFGIILCALLWSQYKLRDKDVELMIRHSNGEITRAEADAQMSRAY